MKLEFLHTQADNIQFIDFLYENACFISYGRGAEKERILSRYEAVSALEDDFLCPFGVYHIHKKGQGKLLVLETCGRQSHPRNLEKRGRRAGVISAVDKVGNIRNML